MFDALKNLKDKAAEIAEAHGDAIDNGLEKVGDFIDDKTDGKYSDKIDTGVDKAQDLVERLGEKKQSD
ncbi:antitoxin [Streptomyces acidicola]|uniref:Antitoxin n=1 Tax=Streptomyces acidicola TaxID=2596892 RepID=A0A5N8WZS1_9ACTN|nr:MULTISPECIES: antitoxin [Streptomyces]MBA2807920.1 antitoxin [Streptomyces sp. KM273126]MPY52769.1 antitoxin [Streptomyces acidicola]